MFPRRTVDGFIGFFLSFYAVLHFIISCYFVIVSIFLFKFTLMFYVCSR